MNAHFEYLYRDAGNNKKWGRVIFCNKENAKLGLLQEQIRKVLIDRANQSSNATRNISHRRLVDLPHVVKTSQKAPRSPLWRPAHDCEDDVRKGSAEFVLQRLLEIDRGRVGSVGQGGTALSACTGARLDLADGFHLSSFSATCSRHI